MPKRKLSSSEKASYKKQMSERSFVSLLKKCDAEYDAVMKESTELLEQSGGGGNRCLKFTSHDIKSYPLGFDRRCQDDIKAPKYVIDLTKKIKYGKLEINNVRLSSDNYKIRYNKKIFIKQSEQKKIKVTYNIVGSSVLMKWIIYLIF